MNKVKLFSIPIYAFSDVRLGELKQEFAINTRSGHEEVPENLKREIIERNTIPNCSTLFNHVVGYITVSCSENDLLFDVFLPVGRKKYLWQSKRKVLIQNVNANGLHFSIWNNNGNEQIQKKIREMFDSIVDEYIFDRYYIEKQCFYRLNACIDYTKLIELSKEGKDNG